MLESELHFFDGDGVFLAFYSDVVVAGVVAEGDGLGRSCCFFWSGGWRGLILCLVVGVELLREHGLDDAVFVVGGHVFCREGFA